MFENIEWLPPLITALIGLVGIFIDRSSRYFSAVLPLFVVGVLLSGYLQYETEQNNKIATIKRNDDFKNIRITNNNIKESNQTLVQSLSSVGTAVNALVERELGAILKSFGMTEELAGIDDLNKLPSTELLYVVAASRVREDLLDKNKAEDRSGTTVMYFTKEGDNKDLSRALLETGLKVSEFDPTNSMASTPTNAVWHGKDVKFEHYKLVILSLMRAKVPIQRLGPVCNTPDIKANRIEVGAAKVADSKQLKTVESVHLAESYADLDDFDFDECPG